MQLSNRSTNLRRTVGFVGLFLLTCAATIGPQLFGVVSNIGPGTLKWNAGVLFGVGSAAPRETFRWQLEYELHF